MINFKKNIPVTIFIAVVLLQLVFLLGMIFSKQEVINNGQTVLLKVVPVDPRDIFRGDYVTLSYEISNLDKAIFDQEITSNDFQSKDSVYVTLVKQGKDYKAKKVTRTKPVGTIFIKGVITGRSWMTETEQIQMNYGLDAYYVPEGTGTRWEELAMSGDLYAEIKVDKNGDSLITKLSE